MCSAIQRVLGFWGISGLTIVVGTRSRNRHGHSSTAIYMLTLFGTRHIVIICFASRFNSNLKCKQCKNVQYYKVGNRKEENN